MSTVKIFVCDTCGRGGFGSKAHMEQHRETHNSADAYRCPEVSCTKAFKAKAYLTKHRRTVHNIPINSQCDICNLSFETIADYRLHCLTHVNRLFHCSQCDKTFPRLSELKSHQFCHTQLRPHACDVCQKSFKRPSDVRRHLTRVHMGYRPL